MHCKYTVNVNFNLTTNKIKKGDNLFMCTDLIEKACNFPTVVTVGDWRVVGGENKSSIESPGLPVSANSPVPARSPHCTAVKPTVLFYELI